MNTVVSIDMLDWKSESLVDQLECICFFFLYYDMNSEIVVHFDVSLEIDESNCSRCMDVDR